MQYFIEITLQRNTLTLETPICLKLCSLIETEDRRYLQSQKNATIKSGNENATNFFQQL